MRELTARELELDKLDWQLARKAGHYPVWSESHRLRCLLDHQHQPGECCHDACFCRQEPLRILGSGSAGPNRPRTISHLPHPLCERESWHPYLECGACCYESGPHPLVSMYPGGGVPYTSKLMEPRGQGPKPKAEEKRPETDPQAEIEAGKELERAE